MKAVILVPFRPDLGLRSRNWGIARQHWARMDLPIFEGDNAGASFERARARNVAAANAGDWDVALFTDADVILENREQAEAAIMRSYLTGAYTVAYSHLRYLTEEGTDILGVENEVGHGTWNEEVSLTWECCFAVRRDIFDKVGGFDERFRGYGGQVAAFFYAYATYGGRQRIKGVAYHLNHPLVDRSDEPNFERNCELADEYKSAVDDPSAMDVILQNRERPY